MKQVVSRVCALMFGVVLMVVAAYKEGYVRGKGI